MKKKRGIVRRLTGFLNSKPFIGVLIFVVLSLANVFAANVIVQDGTLDIAGNLSVGNGNLFVDNVTGRVGIGTTTPQNLLNVAGDINFTGLIYGDGSQLTGVSGEGAANSTAFNRTGTDVILANTGDQVGIGTTTPQNLLNVAGDINFTGLVYGNGSQLTGISSGGSSLWTNDSGIAKYSGNVNITGNLYLGGNLTDLAEMIFSEGVVESGDVVVMSYNMKVKKSYKPYDNKAVGVISTAPAAVFGGNRGDVLLAISGRVLVKAVNESGNIEVGDLLTTSSTKGHAMKCNDINLCFGKIIGKALRPLEEEKGVIEMLIMLA